MNNFLEKMSEKNSNTVLVSKSDLDNMEAYVCTNYMGWTGTTDERKPPSQISKSVIQDEAIITKIEADKIHFRLKLRTNTEHDQSFSAYKIKLNEVEKPLRVVSQTVEVRDYTYSGEYTVAYIRSPNLNINLSKPVENIFRVINREIDFYIFTKTDIDKDIKLEVAAEIDNNSGSLGAIFIFKFVE